MPSSACKKRHRADSAHIAENDDRPGTLTFTVTEGGDGVLDRNLKPVTPDEVFSNDTATTEIYPLSLHDALPICMRDFSLPATMPRGSANTWARPSAK